MKFLMLPSYILVIIIASTISLSNATALTANSVSCDQNCESLPDSKLYDREFLLKKLVELEKTAINIAQTLQNLDPYNNLVKQEIIKFIAFLAEKDRLIRSIIPNFNSSIMIPYTGVSEPLFKQLVSMQDRINILEGENNELKKTDKAINKKIQHINGYLARQDQNIKKHEQQFKMHENVIMNSKVKIHVIEEMVMEHLEGK